MKIIFAIVAFCSISSFAANHSRDDSVVEITAQDQSNNPDSVNVVRNIRLRLVRNKSLSTYAKNVKIISMGDQVTLKGPVRSQNEIQIITNVANSVAPQHQIQNELEVVSK